MAGSTADEKGFLSMIGFWLLVFFAFVALMAAPWWPFSRTWGYLPVSVAGFLLLMTLAFIWFGILVVSPPWQTPVAAVPPA